MERGTIDWAGLRAAATEAARRAYAPYSRLRVGAAGQTDDGRVVVGSNVENASYGLTLCAECGLVSALHGAGPQPDPETGPQQGSGAPALVAVSVVAADGAPLLPCGRCRQLLLEAGGPGLLVDTADGPQQVGSLLPSAFSADELAARRPSASARDEHG
jgi:cytidine deaminase